jgi:5'-deoxy-5'-methylthioadenosine phosphorylase
MKLGLIGGSGLYALDGLTGVAEHTVVTDWGLPSAPVTSGCLNGVELLFLPRHGRQHHLPPHLVNYRANIAALAELGAEAIVATAAVGGIAAHATPGTLVVPHQLIDYTYGRAHTFHDGSRAQPVHIDFTEPYSPELRRLLLAAGGQAGIPLHGGGVYAATQGPRLETAAEIDRLERDGCTIVGMTGMPEAALARERAVAYANISLVVNPAAGRGNAVITMAGIEQELARGMASVRALVAALTTLV